MHERGRGSARRYGYDDADRCRHIASCDAAATLRGVLQCERVRTGLRLRCRGRLRTGVQVLHVAAPALCLTAGLTASFATQHRAITRATLLCTLRVTVHDGYIIPVLQPNSLASTTLPRTHLTSQKAASFLSSAVPRPCSRIFSPPVEHLACTAPMQHCTSSSLSPHGRRREPANLLARQLDVHDNGGGWLHYEASKFNSRRRPTLGYLVIECSAVTAPYWPAQKLEAGRRRKRLQNDTDATRYMAASLHGRG